MHMQKEVVYAGFINMNVGKNITLSTKQMNIDTGTKFYNSPITFSQQSNSTQQRISLHLLVITTPFWVVLRFAVHIKYNIRTLYSYILHGWLGK